MAPTFKPLTITPVAFSLTEGTNIPAPLDSPPATPKDPKSLESSTGGPLSSHPAPTAEHGTMPGAFPPSPSTDAEKKDNEDKLGQLPNLSNNMLSPAQSPNVERKRPSSVRRLLSLRSIRSERDKHSQNGTPGSPLSSHGKQSTDSSGIDYSTRPGSPYTISTIMSSDSSKQSLGRRSSVWFGGAKRKSGFFPIKVEEEASALEGGAVKAPSGPPPPTLPEFRSLGEALDGGDLGADDMFKDIK